MRIDQFHSGTAVGDAITNQMLLIRGILRSSGYESDIYAESVVKPLEREIFSVADLIGSKDDILLVHHSLVIRQFDKIVGLACKKILIYHNITPEHFFEDVQMKKCVNVGLMQARRYARYVDYAIADSNYNRRQLIAMGYSRVDVMPVQVSIDRLKSLKSDRAITKACAGRVNILFVGRVVPNKRQDDVVRAFGLYNAHFNANSHLYLVGDDADRAYVESIRALSRALQIEEKVTLTGKVSENALRAYYDAADVFLCMSEHEGFGVPLLEAMSLGVPVVAYDSSAVRETMGGGGVMFSDKNHPMVAAVCHEIVTNAEFRQRLVARQNVRMEQLRKTDTRKVLLHAIDNVLSGRRPRTIQLQGPFETSYSLAIVNRKLMEALDDQQAGDDVSIYCTEGPGDYEPSRSNVEKVPHAAKLWRKSAEIAYPDVVIRNMYPPRVRDTNGGLNFQYFGWEESLVPPQYIRSFNENLDGIGTMSEYVTKTLIENGIKVPVRTVGVGVELLPGFERLDKFALKTRKHNILLHVSSAFPRKGVDALLKAYCRAFTSEDDVCLVLKTFPNPHNRVGAMIESLKSEHDDPPEIEWIDRDLSTEDLNRLYKTADGYVSVARGEGFGLPIAEAMLARVPVIATPNSGMADFVNESTALTVAFKPAPARTHLQGESKDVSIWFEPDLDDLIEKLRFWLCQRECADIRNRVEAAYELIKTNFSWDAVASRWRRFVDDVAASKRSPCVSMITTWNSKCGIAEYTRMAVEHSAHNVTYRIYPNQDENLTGPDEEFVAERLWKDARSGRLDRLTARLVNDSSSIVHVQFNFGLFDLDELGRLIAAVCTSKSIVITFHSTQDVDWGDKVVSLRTIADKLNVCDALIVHQPSDRENLIRVGVRGELIRVMSLGQIVYPEIESGIAAAHLGMTQTPIVGSYGFLLPHKGIRQVIEALPLLKRRYPDIMFLAVCSRHPSPVSERYYEECKVKVQELDLERNVRFVTDYLTNEESMRFLQACDVLIAPYQFTQESASGAVRFLIAAGKPVITTELPIFREFRSCTRQIAKGDSRSIASAIEGLLFDGSGRADLVSAARQYVAKTSWRMFSTEIRELYAGIERR